MEKQTVVLRRGEEKKHSWRYEEDVDEGDRPVVKTIYFGKHILGEEPPDHVVVTIVPHLSKKGE